MLGIDMGQVPRGLPFGMVDSGLLRWSCCGNHEGKLTGG
jgi:hypothetical protein